MLVTDLALRDMEEQAQSLVGSLGRMLGRLRGRQPEAVEPFSAGTGERPLRALPVAPVAHATRTNGGGSDRPLAFNQQPPASDAAFKWRRHPQLLDRDRVLAERSDQDRLRDAKAAAVRGLFLARSERLGEARSAFAQAAAERSVDLSALPGFWHLSRRAMLVASVAYEDVGRFRDASALAARVRLRYRPRAVPADPSARREASGGD